MSYPDRHRNPTTEETDRICADRAAASSTEGPDGGTERQRAYRQRKAAEEARLQEELRHLRGRGASKLQQRKLVSAKLVKVLGMLGSDHAGERDAAALAAPRLLKEARLN